MTVSLFQTQTGTDIDAAVSWLRQGACVAIPTETVYGLAANALDPAAVVKIFEVKNRPAFDPLIVHLPEIAAVEQYAEQFPAALQRLAAQCWPGPLTILLPRKSNIPDLVTAGLPRVALRVPAHPLAQALLRRLPFPLAAPSANPFGYISPTTAGHVHDQLQGKIPYVLDGGPCTVGVESTIAGWENEQVVIYRLGGMALETIEAITGPVQIMLNQSSNPAAPGMLKSHYAPRKPVYLDQIAARLAHFSGKKIGLITFGPIQTPDSVTQHIVLSPGRHSDEAAQHLFAALRTLDTAPVDLIIAETLPEEGLGRAINDRLRRAAAER